MTSDQITTIVMFMCGIGLVLVIIGIIKLVIGMTYFKKDASIEEKHYRHVIRRDYRESGRRLIKMGIGMIPLAFLVMVLLSIMNSGH